MKSPIVQTLAPITLVGGGDIAPGDLKLALDHSEMLVAADGGARAALTEGQVPDAVIGDMDSLDAETRAAIPQDRLFPIREQDSTDFDKALRSISTPLVLGVGFLGGRVDHQLATFNALIRHADRACILIGAREIILHAPPALTLTPEPGSVVSLFPLAHVSGRSRGLEWPLDGINFAPDGLVGTSNRSLSETHIEMDAPGMLLILPRDTLAQVMRSLLAPERARWPAPSG